MPGTGSFARMQKAGVVTDRPCAREATLFADKAGWNGR